MRTPSTPSSASLTAWALADAGRRANAQRRSDVFAHRPARNQSQVSAVLWNQTESFAYRFLRRRDFQLFAIERGAATERRLDPEQSLRDLRAPGADQSGDAEDFAASHVE